MKPWFIRPGGKDQFLFPFSEPSLALGQTKFHEDDHFLDKPYPCVNCSIYSSSLRHLHTLLASSALFSAESAYFSKRVLEIFFKYNFEAKPGRQSPVLTFLFIVRDLTSGPMSAFSWSLAAARKFHQFKILDFQTFGMWGILIILIFGYARANDNYKIVSCNDPNKESLHKVFF